MTDDTKTTEGTENQAADTGAQAETGAATETGATETGAGAEASVADSSQADTAKSEGAEISVSPAVIEQHKESFFALAEEDLEKAWQWLVKTLKGDTAAA